MKAIVEPKSMSDSQLVEQTRCGDRDAFARIVERYQSLICALTLGACGDLQASQDLAQVTFITAWRELPNLKNPSKLKSWLCGIARNTVNNSFRRQRHVPTANAKNINECVDIPSRAPSPCDQVITMEEERILSRALGELPPKYREPLVLFYRQNRSISEAAEVLGLSDDAVHQRLSRGRILLTERIVRLVEAALRKTGPTKAFTVGVLAALPVLAATAKASTIAMAAAKTSTTAKAAGLSGLIKVVFGIAPIASLGSYVGYKMSQDIEQSQQQRESVAMFWRIAVGCLVAFVALPLLLTPFLAMMMPKESLFASLTVWLGIMYAVILLALIVWALRRRRILMVPEATGQKIVGAKKKRFTIWILLAMAGSACLLVALCFDTNWRVQHPSQDQVQQMIAGAEHKNIQFSILEYPDDERYFWITSRENGKLAKFSAPVYESTLALLTKHGIDCPTYVQGRDFEVLGWPGRYLAFFCVFILAIGIIVLLKQRRTNKPTCSLPPLGSALLHIEHRPPDRDPSATLLLEHPHITAR
jgi:RNA polymerase sigma factor (sigma-70 family)